MRSEKIRLLFKNNFISRYGVFILSLIGAAIIVYFSFDWLNESSTSDWLELHALSLILLTIILVWVANIQLSALNRTAKIDFLMKLDERYGSIEIIKARQLMHSVGRTKSGSKKNMFCF